MLSSLVDIGLQPGDLTTARGEVFLVSNSFRALLTSAGRRIDLDGKRPRSIASLVDGSRVVVGLDDGVLPIDTATGTPGDRVPLDIAALWMVAVERDGRHRVTAVGSDEEGRSRIVDVDFSRTPPAAGPSRTLDIETVWIVAASADGRRLGVVGRMGVPDGSGGTVMRYAAWIRSESGSGTTEDLVFLPDGQTPWSAAIQSDAVYVAAGPGTFLVLDLSTRPPKWRDAPLRSFTGPPPGALIPVDVDGTPALLCMLETAGEIAAIDLSGRALWGAEVGRSPIAVALDRATGYAAVVDSDNDNVYIVDSRTGRGMGRIVLDVALGDDGGAWQGIALHDRKLLVVGQRWRTLATVDTGTLAPGPAILLRQDWGAPRAVVVDERKAVWVLHEHELGVVADGSTREEAKAENLPARGRMLAVARDGAIVVGMLDRIAVFRDDGRGLRPAATVPGILDWLEAEPGGGVFAVWDRENALGYGVVGAARWNLDVLELGMLPDQQMPALGPPYEPLGQTRLPQGLMIFFGRAGEGTDPDAPVALLLGPDLHAGTPVASPMRYWGPLAPTPDGRRFFYGAANTLSPVLHYAEVGADGRLSSVSALPLDGVMRGIVVDPRGERAFVLLGGINRVAVVQ